MDTRVGRIAMLEKVVLNKIQSLSDDLDKELIMYVQIEERSSNGNQNYRNAK